MEQINAIGLTCPLPVVHAKKALEKPDIDAITIKVDNFIAVENLKKMALVLGYEFSYDRISDSEFDTVLSKHKSENAGSSNHEPTHDTRHFDNFIDVDSMKDGDGVVVAIGSETMGSGENELGKVLMKSFIYSLTELPVKPNTILFFNSGAFLSSGDSDDPIELLKIAGVDMGKPEPVENAMKKFGKLVEEFETLAVR